MEFDLATETTNFPWLATVGILIGTATFIYPIVDALSIRKLHSETIANMFSAGFFAIFFSGLMGLAFYAAALSGDYQKAQEQAATVLSQQAQEVYGVDLTTEEAAQLVGDASPQELNDGLQGITVHRLGSIDTAEGGSVSTLELVWIEDGWLLASGESDLEELPRLDS